MIESSRIRASNLELTGSACIRYSCFVIATFMLAGCVFGPRANSPDVVYSSDPAKARKIQVPPDLSAVAPDEQFVLPGDSGGVISRNTLLPVLKDGKYVRSGDRDWLELAATPEALWPRLLQLSLIHI